MLLTILKESVRKRPDSSGGPVLRDPPGQHGPIFVTSKGEGNTRLMLMTSEAVMLKILILEITWKWGICQIARLIVASSGFPRTIMCNNQENIILKKQKLKSTMFGTLTI